jgi:hypothetical protein
MQALRSILDVLLLGTFSVVFTIDVLVFTPFVAVLQQDSRRRESLTLAVFTPHSHSLLFGLWVLLIVVLFEQAHPTFHWQQ